MRTEELFYGRDCEHVIVAPHCDDEFIGCYEIMVNAERVHVLIQESSVSERLKESHKVMRNVFAHANGGKSKTIEMLNLASKTYVGSREVQKVIFWFPDPIHEHHPAHKIFTPALQTRLATNIMQARGTFAMFGLYSTNMRVPYLHELPKELSERKARESKVFKTQKGYFEKHNDSFFFEGRILL